VSVPTTELQRRVLGWYDRHARELPWRDPDAGAWAVLVSEIMLQQTQVSRVLPAYRAWLERWPTPAALAADPVGEAVRAWGRLGYPRRAIRLHQAATAITERHGGVVPSDIESLRALPGIGDYTAAAVATFAYQGRHPVLDTNVRRVLTRAIDGAALPGPSVRVAERETARGLLPDDPSVAARWSVAVMELGALVCTARGPRCEACPIADRCRWRTSGYPAYDGPRSPTTGPTGSAVARCWPCSGPRPGRCPGESSKPPGTSRSSVSGPWTAWSRTGWSSRSTATGSGCHAESRPDQAAPSLIRWAVAARSRTGASICCGSSTTGIDRLKPVSAASTSRAIRGARRGFAPQPTR
jgi:A/G-specific adenine glycosylase